MRSPPAEEDILHRHFGELIAPAGNTTFCSAAVTARHRGRVVVDFLKDADRSRRRSRGVRSAPQEAPRPRTIGAPAPETGSHRRSGAQTDGFDAGARGALDKPLGRRRSQPAASTPAPSGGNSVPSEARCSTAIPSEATSPKSAGSGRRTRRSTRKKDPAPGLPAPAVFLLD